MVAIIHAVPELDARINVVKHFKRIEVLSGPGAGIDVRGAVATMPAAATAWRRRSGASTSWAR